MPACPLYGSKWIVPLHAVYFVDEHLRCGQTLALRRYLHVSAVAWCVVAARLARLVPFDGLHNVSYTAPRVLILLHLTMPCSVMVHHTTTYGSAWLPIYRSGSSLLSLFRIPKKPFLDRRVGEIPTV